MERIMEMQAMDRPREKLLREGAIKLSDEELLAILLGSGTPTFPLHVICNNLLEQYELRTITQLDQQALIKVRGIGTAKAAILLAVTEFCRRAQASRLILKDERACYEHVKLLLAPATQLQYIFLLCSANRELLAFSEVGSVLPDMVKLTQLATEAGAGRLLLARNGWPAFSNAESRYLVELRAACAALNILCDGLMAVGPQHFKMI